MSAEFDPMEARDFAAYCVARAICSRGPDEDILVNTNGYTAFPDEVLQWDRSVGPYTFYPMHVLAAFAAGHPVPEPGETDVASTAAAKLRFRGVEFKIQVREHPDFNNHIEVKLICDKPPRGLDRELHILVMKAPEGET